MNFRWTASHLSRCTIFIFIVIIITVIPCVKAPKRQELPPTQVHSDLPLNRIQVVCKFPVPTVFCQHSGVDAGGFPQGRNHSGLYSEFQVSQDDRMKPNQTRVVVGVTHLCSQPLGGRGRRVRSSKSLSAEIAECEPHASHPLKNKNLDWGDCSLSNVLAVPCGGSPVPGGGGEVVVWA